ncbi:MAG: 50S ribosomal protein L19 [Candidatus Omnitrophota bacterium]
MDKRIKMIEEKYLKKDIPNFKAGDTVKVQVRIVEEGKKRLQTFEGIVIAKKRSGLGETFTVRKISFGEGVERIFPLHSPAIEKIIVTKRGDVKRAKLYYLRKRVGKATKVEERFGKEDAAEAVATPDEAAAVPREETAE